MKILVAEDDRHTRQAIVELLTGEGHLVMSAADGRAALEMFQAEAFELACLDVMMPCLSGYDLCREIRRHDNMPILFLTAKAEEIDKVVGLELGADDYIVKPFGSQEFLARVRAIARRCQRLDTPRGESSADGSFMFGPWEVVPRQQRARCGEQTLELSPRELRLLRMLHDRRGEVVSRRELFNGCWGMHVVPNSRTLDQTISQLRKRIEADPANPRLIQTVYGVGYRHDAVETQ